MKRYHISALLVLLFCAVSVPSWGEATSGVKINPSGVDYPLVKASQYKSSTADPYEMSFGVRRWLSPLRMAQDQMYAQTVAASEKWFNRYNGYGVLGHGEDVFSRKGAEFRRLHRGR